MKLKTMAGLLGVGLFISSCGSKKNQDDDTFANIESSDVRDQDSLSLDEGDMGRGGGTESDSGSKAELVMFTKSDEALPIGGHLWTKKFAASWISGCSPKKSPGQVLCVVKNSSGEKAVVAVKHKGGTAKRIFIDAKGAEYRDLWAGELNRAGFEKAGANAYSSSKLRTKAKIIFVKKLNAATLILEPR